MRKIKHLRNIKRQKRDKRKVMLALTGVLLAGPTISIGAFSTYNTVGAYDIDVSTNNLSEITLLENTNIEKEIITEMLEDNQKEVSEKQKTTKKEKEEAVKKAEDKKEAETKKKEEAETIKKETDKPEVKKEESKSEPVVTTQSVTEKLYTLNQFMFSGVINWGGYKFTYYSQKILPGGGLVIPGRHVNADGYVSDGEGYIVLAGSAPKGTIYPTPFGYYGKIYDRGTVGNHLDVYIM